MRDPDPLLILEPPPWQLLEEEIFYFIYARPFMCLKINDNNNNRSPLTIENITMVVDFQPRM